jgi:hypothetical protein
LTEEPISASLTWARFLYQSRRIPVSEEGMDTNWEHQKKAITTDQKNRTDDEHIHERDKRHLKESEEDAGFVPKPTEKPASSKKE